MPVDQEAISELIRYLSQKSYLIWNDALSTSNTGRKLILSELATSLDDAIRAAMRVKARL